jgi:hypothetical protein
MALLQVLLSLLGRLRVGRGNRAGPPVREALENRLCPRVSVVTTGLNNPRGGGVSAPGSASAHNIGARLARWPPWLARLKRQ